MKRGHLKTMVTTRDSGPGTVTRVRKLVQKTKRVRGARVTYFTEGKCLSGHEWRDGKCSVCGAKQPGGSQFARLQYLSWWTRCMRETWQRIGVEMFRERARAALRGVVDGTVVEPDYFDFDVRIELSPMLEAAMLDHRLRHPSARGDNPWSYANPDKRGHADVRCRFCGKVLLPQVKLGRDYSPRVADHTYPCALTSLATASSVAPPKTKE